MVATEGHLDDYRKRKVYLLKPRSGLHEDKCCCLEINEENHTMGNMLRCVAMKDSRVEFSGYCLPHPTEDVVNMRIQLFENAAKKMKSEGSGQFAAPVQVFMEAVEDLESGLSYLLQFMKDKVNEFEGEHSSPAPFRRTIPYLEKGDIILRPQVKVLLFNLTTENPCCEGLRQFIFWRLPQLQYKNPNVQILQLLNMIPNPVITAILSDDSDLSFYSKVYVDCYEQSMQEIHLRFKKLFNIKKLTMDKALTKDDVIQTLCEESDARPTSFGYQSALWVPSSVCYGLN
ncbi:hypothetical protein ACOME3_003973 [Neoechinorhynchus agilis]